MSSSVVDVAVCFSPSLRVRLLSRCTMQSHSKRSHTFVELVLEMPRPWNRTTTAQIDEAVGSCGKAGADQAHHSSDHFTWRAVPSLYPTTLNI